MVFVLEIKVFIFCLWFCPDYAFLKAGCKPELWARPTPANGQRMRKTCWY